MLWKEWLEECSEDMPKDFVKQLVDPELSGHSSCFGVEGWVLRRCLGGTPGTDVFGQWYIGTQA